MPRESSRRRVRSVLGWCLALLVALVVLPAAAAWAGDDHADREVAQVKARIEALLRESEELEDAGRLDAAREAKNRARRLRGKLAEYFTRREREAQAHAKKKKERKGKAQKSQPRKTKGGKQDLDLKKVLEGLEHGMKALHALGGHEEAIRELMRVSGGVKKRMHHARGKQEKRADRSHAERERGHEECKDCDCERCAKTRHDRGELERLERLEHLQRQLNELTQALRRLQGQLEEFARRR